MKKLIIAIVCSAFAAPLAFGQQPQAITLDNGVTVTGKPPVISVESGEAASYQPPNTLVVRHGGPGIYVLKGRGHVLDSKGRRVTTAVPQGARLQVHFVSSGGVKTIDHVVVR